MRSSNDGQAKRGIRVILAGRTAMDCQLLAASLRRHSRRCRVVGSAVSGAAMRAALKHLRPNVAVISPQLEEGPLAGFELVREVRDSFPSTKSILLLDSLEPRMVIRAYRAGARGVFSRDKSVEELYKCIEVVGRGQIWAGDGELQFVMEAIARRPDLESGPSGSRGTQTMTGREAEIAGLVAEGLRNREISQKLALSAHTVKNYLYRIYEKLGISSRVELATYLLAPEAKTPRSISTAQRSRRAVS